MTTESLLTIDEAAGYLHVSKTSLRRWTKLGLLPCVRIGARHERRFRSSDLESFLRASPTSRAPFRGTPDSAASTPLAALDQAAAQSIPRHVCLHYRTTAELWELFLPYVSRHLQREAPVLYIHRAGHRDDVIAELTALGYDAEQLVADGRVTLLEPVEAYLAGGQFAARRMIRFIESAIQQRVGAGNREMLIAGEMSWYLSGAEGVQEMIPYEDALNALLLRYPDVTIVCQYDINRLSAEINLGAICTHTHVHMPDRFVQGFYGR